MCDARYGIGGCRRHGVQVCGHGQGHADAGQASIEALVGFAAFLAALAVFGAALGDAIGHAHQSSEDFSAKLEAEGCALVVDSFYAGGGNLHGFSTVCFVGGRNTVAVAVHGSEKRSVVINQRTAQDSDGEGIGVEVVEHYR